MNLFVFTKHSKTKFLKLETEIQQRIKQKFIFLKNHPNVFSNLSKLKDFKNTRYRLRVGSFRLILRLMDSDKNTLKFLVSEIGHRREIYRYVA